jgi:cytoskeleton protein RodZ
LLEEAVRSKKKRGFGSAFSKLLVLALLLGGAYYYYTHMSSAPVQSRTADTAAGNGVAGQPFVAPDSPASATTEPEPSPPAGTASTRPADKPAAAASTPERAPERSPALPATPENPTSEADPVSTHGFIAPTTATPASSMSTSVPALPEGMHQIVVTAEADCWLHANADGTETRSFTLIAGDTFAMPFQSNMILKLGNAGGVRIKYDGVEMPIPGASGQVKTITFPPSD